MNASTIHRFIEKELAKLPVYKRTIMDLYLIEQLTIPEIAIVKKLSEPEVEAVVKEVGSVLKQGLSKII